MLILARVPCTRKSHARSVKASKVGGKIKSRTTYRAKKSVPKRRRVLPKLKKGTLKGYSLKLSASARKRVIARMMKQKGGLITLRHLVVLRSYN